MTIRRTLLAGALLGLAGAAPVQAASLDDIQLQLQLMQEQQEYDAMMLRERIEEVADDLFYSRLGRGAAVLPDELPPELRWRRDHPPPPDPQAFQRGITFGDQLKH